MTNRDRLMAMTDEELSEFLCGQMEDIQGKTKEDDYCCDICPVSKLCKKGKNGFLTWLEAKTKEG